MSLSALTPASAPAPTAATDLIKDTTVRTFMADVIDASMQTPVIVDFWATWCGPCKTLVPLLEKAVIAAKGAVRMVKVDIDKNPEIAGQMRIQSVPTVYAFWQGQPVDGFAGAQPESKIKAFIDKLIGLSGQKAGGADISQILADAATLLAAGNTIEAAALYEGVLEQDPEQADAFAGLAKTFLAQGMIDAAKAMLDDAPAALAGHKALVPVRTQLDLIAESGSAPSDIEALKAKLDGNANDHQTRFDLGLAEYAAGNAEGALDCFLEIVRRNRGWNEEAARKQLVKIFEALGPTDPLTLSARRRLSSILFS
jgi:putative thioredoxin